MAALSNITITHERRPCSVAGKNYGEPSIRAWFHQWFYKETLLLHNIGRLMKTDDAKKHKKAVMDVGVIPIGEEPVITKELLALVEYENGHIAYVEPTRISFLDTKRVEDEYYISRNVKPEDRYCRNCRHVSIEKRPDGDMYCHHEGNWFKVCPTETCNYWETIETYPEKECEIRGE